jgi:hypothetical protein
MRTENQSCSMFAIDAEALGERPLSEAERTTLTNDPERRRRFDEHRARQAEFLRRFPTLESLSSATRQSPQRSGNRLLRLAVVPLAAAAVLALVVLLPKTHQRQADDGIKGTLPLPLEMAVVRQGVARAFVGQAVHQGDKLIFRTRVAVDYLSIFSLEASGRVQAIVIGRAQGDKDENGQSLAVHLPPNAPCPQAIEIDNYPGRERIVAVASAAPLPAERIASWLRSSYAAMPSEGRELLPLGPPPFTAQVTTWLLEKETTP